MLKAPRCWYCQAMSLMTPRLKMTRLTRSDQISHRPCLNVSPFTSRRVGTGWLLFVSSCSTRSESQFNLNIFNQLFLPRRGRKGKAVQLFRNPNSTIRLCNVKTFNLKTSNRYQWHLQTCSFSCFPNERRYVLPSCLHWSWVGLGCENHTSARSHLRSITSIWWMI